MPGTVSSTSPGRLIGRDLELRRGDGALTRGGGDAHEILGRVLDVDDVAEGAGPGDDDIGVERESQHVLGGDGDSAADPDQTPEHTEIEQSKRELRRACRHCPQSDTDLLHRVVVVNSVPAVTRSIVTPGRTAPV